MKTLLTLPIALASLAATAQCSFDPTVTPNNLILCPNTQDVLSTQVYDSYQWYKDGNLIPGATAQTLGVDAFQDAGATFSVEATDDACTEMSPAVLVDGWAFLPPSVITDGDPSHTDSLFMPYYCDGDTALLILMQPYEVNIQWTNNGQVIPGATNDTLVVTQTGNYTVSGAPALCPNFNQQLGVIIPMNFVFMMQASIVPLGTELCVYPTGNGTQWYFNGNPIVTTDCFTPTISGTYTALVDYGSVCTTVSEPYDFVLAVPETSRAQVLTAWPNPAKEDLAITAAQPYTGTWQLFDLTGRAVRSGSVKGVQRFTVDVRGAATGRYWFSADGMPPIAVSVVH
ncbi:MAG: hypothetical protein ABI599_11875 [Flavobacteriales bacterium]